MNALLLLIKVTLFLVAALLLVRLLARANPRWRLLICEGAAVSLLLIPVLTFLPFFELSLPLPSDLNKPAQPSAESRAIEGLGGKSELGQAELFDHELGNGSGGAIPFLQERSFHWSSVLVIGYLSGLLFFAWRYGFSVWRMRQVFAELEEGDGRPLVLLRAIAEEAGLERIPNAVTLIPLFVIMGSGGKKSSTCGWSSAFMNT